MIYSVLDPKVNGRNNYNMLKEFRSLYPEGNEADSNQYLQAKKWLDEVLSGRYPEPKSGNYAYDLRDERHPLDLLLTRKLTQEDCLRLADLAGDLFEEQMDAFKLLPSSRIPEQDKIEKLSQILCLFQGVTAPAETSRRIFELYKSHGLAGLKSERGDIERDLLIVLAISPPPESPETLERFFVEEMNGNYSFAAFIGLRRNFLKTAINHVPELLRFLQRKGLPPHEAVFSIIRAIALTDPSQALKLREVLEKAGRLEGFVEIAELLNTQTEHPDFWEVISKPEGKE